MAVAFGAAGTRWMNGATGVTPWLIPYPAGITAGQLLVLALETNGCDTPTTPPAGWTTIYRHGGAATPTNPRGGLYYRVADGTESGTLSFALAAGGTTTTMQGTAQMFRYTGVDTTTPLDVAAGTYTNNLSTDPAVVLPSLTTVTAGAMLIMMGAPNSGSVTVTAPGTSTLRVDHGALGGTGNKGGFFADEARPTAGATGTRTFTWSAGRANFGAIAALRPAAGGSSPQTVNPGAVSSTATAGTPTITTAAQTAPGGVGITAGRGTAAVSTAVLVTPTGKGLTAGAGSPVLSAAVLTAPQGVSASALRGNPAVSTAATSQPTGVAVGVTEGSPAASTPNGPQTAAPAGIAATAAEGTPTLAAVVSAVPSGASVGVGRGNPVITGATTARPAALTVTAAEGTPTLTTAVTSTPAGKALAATPAAPAVTTAATASPDGAGATTAAGTPDVSTGLTAAPSSAALIVFLGAPVATVSQDQEVAPAGINAGIISGSPALAFFFRAVIGIIVEGDRWKASAGTPRYFTEDDDPARAAASTSHQQATADPTTRWGTQ